MLENRVGVTHQRNQGNITRGTVGGKGANICRGQYIGPGWHVYGGAFHMLSEGWRIPSMTFVQLISMWLAGDQENGVPSLRHVTVYH